MDESARNASTTKPAAADDEVRTRWRTGPDGHCYRIYRYAEAISTPLRRAAIGRWFAPVLALQLSACSGCIQEGLSPLTFELRNTVDTLDRAIDSLTRESGNWQLVVSQLEAQLVSDLRSTLQAEATDLLRNGVHGSGVEVRCNSEYLARRAATELTRIRNDLADQFNSMPGKNSDEPQLSERTAPALQPFICSSVPSAVDLNLAPERRTKLDVYGFNLRTAPINTEVVRAAGARRDVTNALGIISDFHMALDLSDGGAAPIPADARIVFSWLKQSRSVVPIISASRRSSCQIRTLPLLGEPHTFTPPHIRGDQDFAGHGPCVRLRGSLEVDPEGSAINARIRMLARECDGEQRSQSDFTTASGETSVQLHKVPDGTRILGFDLDPIFEDNYRDSNHGDDLRTFAGTSIFEKIRYVGDTGGDEAGTRTQVELFFRRIELRVEQCSESPPPG